MHTLGVIVPGLAFHYLYREQNRPKLAALVILRAIALIAVRFYFEVSV